PVTIFVQGPNKWRAEKAWPIPDAKSVRLYLHGGAAENKIAAKSGALKYSTPARAAQPSTFDYDPERGPFLKTMLSSGRLPPGMTPRLAIDHSADESYTTTWTSDPL